MRPSPLPSAFGRKLQPRERRTIAISVALVAVAALVTQVLLPSRARWTEREALIHATRERLARIESMAGREQELLDASRALDAQLDGFGSRVIRARNVALASSALQAMVREQARASVVTVTRLDAAGAPLSSGTTIALPATLSAQGDIYGIADFLRRLQHGPTLVEITDLSIAPNPVLRGNLLQVSIGLRAPIEVNP